MLGLAGCLLADDQCRLQPAQDGIKPVFGRNGDRIMSPNTVDVSRLFRPQNIARNFPSNGCAKFSGQKLGQHLSSASSGALPPHLSQVSLGKLLKTELETPKPFVWIPKHHTTYVWNHVSARNSPPIVVSSVWRRAIFVSHVMRVMFRPDISSRPRSHNA